MRVTFLLLLLINLLVYVWGAGYLGLREAGHEPERLTSQLNPYALRVLAPAPPSHCQMLSELDDAQLVQLRKQFAETPSVAFETSETLLPGKYWVAIANLESREVATRKQAELVKLGVSDSRLVEDARNGPFLVILGDYTEATAAQAVLDALAPKGVRSPRLITREAPSARYRIRLTWPDNETPARSASLDAWLATLGAGHVVKRGACPAP